MIQRINFGTLYLLELRDQSGTLQKEKNVDDMKKVMSYAVKVYSAPFLANFLENYQCDVTINFHE